MMIRLMSLMGPSLKSRITRATRMSRSILRGPVPSPRPDHTMYSDTTLAATIKVSVCVCCPHQMLGRGWARGQRRVASFNEHCLYYYYYCYHFYYCYYYDYDYSWRVASLNRHCLYVLIFKCAHEAPRLWSAIVSVCALPTTTRALQGKLVAQVLINTH